jgi:hypothetical protein
MEISISSFAPLNNSVRPGFELKGTLSAQRDEIISHVWGELLTNDGVLLSDLKFREYWNSQPNRPLVTDIYSPYISDTSEGRRNHFSFQITLTATVDENVIDFIEKIREKNPKKDVIFTMKINVSYFKIHIRAGEYNVGLVPNAGNTKFVILADSRTKEQNNTNLKMLVSESQQGNNLTFSSLVETVTIVKTIASSDWVNDFQVPLGVGKFLLVEIIQPGTRTDGVERNNLDAGEKRLAQRLLEAQNKLQSIEELLRVGEWGKVVKDSVELFEILKRDNVSTITAL